MSLSFNQNRFILDPTFEMAKKLFSSPLKDRWAKISPDEYATQDLQAAAEFRRYADDDAIKILDRTLGQRFDVPLLPPLPFLDPHQLDGIKWILSRSRSYLAHAPGAGKTAQAIIASHFAEGSGRVVFIVPPSLTHNWEREIWKFTETLEPWPTIAIVPVSAKQAAMDWNAHYIVVPDSMLTRPWVYERLRAMKIKFLGVDEASRFKEATAERSLAFYGGRSKRHVYRGLARRARHTVMLDGSPMPNRPMELWAPLYALAPLSIDCMSQNDFGLKYCGAQMNDFGQWEFNHSSNEAELNERITRDFMHVVGEERLKHPERRRSMVFINRDVRTGEMKTWERRHLQDLSTSDLSEDASQGDLARMRREIGIAKVPWVAAYIQDRLRNGKESLLVFAWHREVCLELATRLAQYRPGVVMGGVSNEVREKVFGDFQSGRRRIIIGNISAMGRGHNLQRADRVIFAEYSWTDELNKQCEKRASRRGRDQSAMVRCEYLVAPRSLDELVLSSIFTKEKRVQRVIG